MPSDLALAVKGSWGYDQAFIKSCRDELAFDPDDIARRHFVVADLGVKGTETQDRRRSQRVCKIGLLP